ncbi:hypothetical protein [Methyloglobulus sp.]|uniref:hypothetical protein n=1 Tax=Methyloglobulus sp. TaxID=2518622 RepID=UPI003988E654
MSGKNRIRQTTAQIKLRMITGRSGLARRLKSGNEWVCESRHGLRVQSCIVLGVCLDTPESEHPGMCSGIAVNAEGIGIVQVAVMAKEIQLTSNTNTNVCR